jgi:opacity protein-like surface antigen
MKYSCWLLIVFLLIGIYGQAQRKGMFYKTAFNISPLALANTDGQLMAGIEHRSGKGWAYVFDAGYIFSSYYLNHAKKVKGFELRPAIRYYHGKYKREYWQAQLFYKKVDYQFRDWLGKDVVNGTPSYEKLQDFTFRKKVLSFSFMGGETIPLSDNIFIDVYGGIGARYKEQAVTEPNSVYEPVEGNTPIIYGPKVWSICAPVGVKLSFVLR